MNKLILSLLLLTPLFNSAYATNNNKDKSTVVLAAEDNKYTPAVIKKIDKENGKITFKHEQIKNLEMPGMTMIFKLKLTDMSVVDALKDGDNVKAFFDKTSDGFVVKEIIKNP